VIAGIVQLTPLSWPDLLWHAGYLVAMGLVGLMVTGKRIAKLLLF